MEPLDPREALARPEEVADFEPVVEPAQGPSVSRRRFDPRELIGEVVGRRRAIALSRGLALGRPPVDSGPAAAWGDPEWTREVLDLLVERALDATAAGSVSVRVERGGGGRFRVEVEDTGGWLDEAALDGLFEADDAARVSAGLPLVKVVVERMGGAVGARLDPGGRAVLWMELPAAG